MQQTYVRRDGRRHWSECDRTCEDEVGLELDHVFSSCAKIPLWHPPLLHTGAALALEKDPAAAAANGKDTESSRRGDAEGSTETSGCYIASGNETPTHARTQTTSHTRAGTHVLHLLKPFPTFISSKTMFPAVLSGSNSNWTCLLRQGTCEIMSKHALTMKQHRNLD